MVVSACITEELVTEETVIEQEPVYVDAAYDGKDIQTNIASLLIYIVTLESNPTTGLSFLAAGLHKVTLS